MSVVLTRRDRFSRRRFLAATGIGAGFLPLVGTDVLAAVQPKRVIFIGWTNGYVMSDWRPQGTEREFSFGETLKPLSPWKDKVIVVDGVGQKVHYEANAKAMGWGKDQWYGGHDATPAALTGVPLSVYTENVFKSGGDSIDQYIANQLIAQGISTPLASLVTGPWADASAWGTFSFRGQSAGITAESNPFNLWKRLFEGRNLPKATLDRNLAVRKSVLDYLGKTLTAFSSRLGTEDKQRVDAHLQAVRDTEKELAALGSAPMTQGCTAPSLPATFDTRNTIANYPRTLSLLNQLVVAAVSCDLTRVVTMPWTDAAGDYLVFSWLGADFTGKGDEYPTRQYHDITHNQGKSPAHRARKIRVEQWFHEQVAAMVKQLADSQDAGGGSMLDNTMVVVTNTMGSNHDSKVQPFTLIGNLGGAFKTGRYVKTSGEAHNKVLVTLANAMGVDGTKWGSPKYATELPNLRGL